MRRAARTDANHSEIRDALRDVPGCVVGDTHSLGDGFPDLVIGWRGRWIPVEIKDGSKPQSARALTEAEAKWHAVASEHSLPVAIVCLVVEVFGLLVVGENRSGKVRG